MLVLSRKEGDKIMIGDDIEVTLLQRDAFGQTQIGIAAPDEVRIWRREVWLRRQAEEKLEAERVMRAGDITSVSVDGELIADWNLSPGLASKLASVVVHAQEMFEERDKSTMDPNALAHDEAALRSEAFDREIDEWIKRLGPIAPLRRSKR